MTKDSRHLPVDPGPAACREDFFKEIEIEFLIHELKDPISIVETGAQTLLKKQERFGPLTERQVKTVNRIIRNAAKARQMLYGLLEIGRAEAGSFNCTHFSATARTFESLMECLELRSPATAEKVRQYGQGAAAMACLEDGGILFKAAPAAADLQVFQDETKFRQIIGNLIKNALHYRSERLELRLDVENDAFVAEVIDDGPGIPEKYQQSIFRRYTQVAGCRQNARNGHGLGLAGARTLARSLGGDIRVSSRVNEGASFRLRMPIKFENDAEN